MDITEVRIKLMEGSEDRLRAFCSITFDDCFVVRDLKVIEGANGPFVAMPSRKLTGRCDRCGNKNHIRSNYCNNCGSRLKSQRRAGGGDATQKPDTPNKLYADVAHPINQQCRDMIQRHVVDEYQLELERAKLPGYASRYDDSYESSEPSQSQQASPATGVSPPGSGSAIPEPHFRGNSPRDSAQQSKADSGGSKAGHTDANDPPSAGSSPNHE